MSAFIVSNETIDQVTAAIHDADQLSVFMKELGLSPVETVVEARAAIGEALHRLNVDAVNFRYREDTEYSYTARWASGTTPAAKVKAIESFTYQCCEGPYAHSPLLKLLDDVANVLARRALRRASEYQDAAWG